MTVNVIELGKVASAIAAIVALVSWIFKTVLKPVLDRLDGHDTRLCELDGHDERLTALETRDMEQTKKINDISEQNRIVIYALSALLKGQIEQGCDGPVTEADQRLDDYLKERPFR